MSSRNFILILSLLFISCSKPALNSSSSKNEDNFMWLEKRRSQKALHWVSHQREIVEAKFMDSEIFKSTKNSILSLSSERKSLPSFKIEGEYAYSVYKKDKNSRGQWRRTPKQNLGSNPKNWDVVLDFDKLAEAEGKKFSLRYVDCLEPRSRLCLLYLSETGGDAVEVREFDTLKKVFPKNGFRLKTGKNSVSWLDQDHLSFSSNLGQGKITSAGFGASLRILARGEKISATKPIISVPKDYYTVIPYKKKTTNGSVSFASRYHSVNKADEWVFEGRRPLKLDIPNASYIWGVSHGHIIFSLKEKWEASGQVFRSNGIIAVDIKSVLKQKGSKFYKAIEIYRPKSGEFLSDEGAVTENFIVLNLIQDVRGKIKFVKFDGKALNSAKTIEIKNENLKLVETDYSNDTIYFSKESFTSPKAIIKHDLNTSESRQIYRSKSQFDAKNILVKRQIAISEDGTRVPFYLVGKKNALKKGSAPTIIEGYGGYGISLLPKYNPNYGKLWLEKGGVYILANIRGGGELGSDWHKAATKKNKIKSIEDFIAISEKVISTGLTSSKKLGIAGGSLGGIVIGGAMVLRPELYKAAFVHVPDLDPILNLKLGGGSWMGELGDPRIKAERSAMLKYSPYQNLKKGVKYPSFFAYSTTSDDRVHPAHGRKFTAKLRMLGNTSTYYYEASDGGHGTGNTILEKSLWKSLRLTFFIKKLGL